MIFVCLSKGGCVNVDCLLFGKVEVDGLVVEVDVIDEVN